MNIKSITEKAMLVKLSISQWSARKYDRQVTDEINQIHNTIEAGRFNKVLIKQDEIKAIGKIANMARTFHYENTLPWNDDSYRLLPVANFDKYRKSMNEFKDQFYPAVNNLENRYYELILDAEKRLNGMFNRADYPNNIKDKYSISTDIIPVPNSSDFRIAIDNDVKKEIEKEIDSRAEKAISGAQTDIYNRMADNLNKLVNKLSEKKGVFRDSLINNLSDLCNLIPALNVTNDSNLDRLKREIENKICNFNAQDYRDDNGLKIDAIKTAKTILTDINKQDIRPDANTILDSMQGIY